MGQTCGLEVAVGSTQIAIHMRIGNSSIAESNGTIADVGEKKWNFKQGSVMEMLQTAYDKANQTLCTAECECSGSKENLIDRI